MVFFGACLMIVNTSSSLQVVIGCMGGFLLGLGGS